MRRKRSIHLHNKRRRHKPFLLRKGSVASMLLIFIILVFSVFLGMSRGSLSVFRIFDYSLFSGWDTLFTVYTSNKNVQMQTFTAITPTLPVIAKQNAIRRAQLRWLRSQGRIGPYDTCADKVDVLLVLDATTMSDPDTTDQIKKGAHDLVQAVSAMQNSRVGLITYDTTARFEIGLTNDLPTVTTLIDRVTAPNVSVSGSCISCGAALANTEIRTQGRSTTAFIVFLFTNGRATHIDGYAAHPSLALQAATAEIARGYTEFTTVFNTASYGEVVNPGFVTNVGYSTSGSHYNYPGRTDFAQALNVSLQNFCQ